MAKLMCPFKGVFKQHSCRKASKKKWKIKKGRRSWCCPVCNVEYYDVHITFGHAGFHNYCGCCGTRLEKPDGVVWKDSRG
jgi:ribosomal protein S27E